MSVLQSSQLQTQATAESAVGLIDCDVHNTALSVAYLKKYLPQRWHTYVPQLFGRTLAGVTIGARQSSDLYRRDSHPPGGGPPGSDLDFLREQLLDRWGVTKAILNPLEVLGWMITQYGELAHALSAASNRWLTEEWLANDDRLYASISIPQEDGPRAAAEIERLAGDRRFVGVLMTVWAREAFGHPKYLPILETASALELPVIIHVGGWSGTLVAGGTPTYWCEHHTLFYQAFATHVASLVYSGVFDRLPNLKIVLEEGGIGWMPAPLWRMDRAWSEMRGDVPHLTRKPSEVVREHFWFTTQPLDEPGGGRQLATMFEHLGMDDRVMFATDYPHHDFDSPDRVLPSALGVDLREKIFARNAEALFRFRGSTVNAATEPHSIDSGVHCAAPPLEALVPYLSNYWRAHVTANMLGGKSSGTGRLDRSVGVPFTAPAWSQALALPSDAVSLEAIRDNVLSQSERAVVHCYAGVEAFTHPYFASALATAVNRWLRDEVLDREPRLLASAVIAPAHTASAVEEIQRIAEDPRFVQIAVPVRAIEPYGSERYWPIWEAAAAHGLALAIIFGGASLTPPTPVNWPSSFYELYVDATQQYGTHVASLTFSGIFDRLPDWKVVLLESGWTWLPPLLWRMDWEWKGSRREVPWVRAAPSEYARSHFRLTTQPCDAPDDPRQLREVIDQLGSDGMLLYASDYPRSNSRFDDLLSVLDADAAERVLWRNAVDCYSLEGTLVDAQPSSAGEKL